MINLLPYTEKKMIQKIRFLRMVNTVLSGILIVFLLSWLLLFPTLLTINSRFTLANKQVATLIREEKMVTDADVSALDSAVREVEKKLAQTAPTNPLSYISTIRKATPKGVTLDRISINSERVVDVFGKAPNREALQIFIKTLNSEKDIEKVDSPLSNLVKTKAGDFKITVVFKQKNI